MTPRQLLAAAVLPIAYLFAFHPAHAAQSFDGCAGFIDSIPTTIDTQGVWCLRHDLSTNITDGAAITIATNNVTIDCNDFKLGGLAAGDGSLASGINAESRQNATVRHCNIRGFFFGINFDGDGGGHLVEDNRLDNNLFYAIIVKGDSNLVQRNRVLATGGATGSAKSVGIYANGDILDNTVDGVFAVGSANTTASGIVAYGSGSEVRRNRVRGLTVTGTGRAIGIYVGESNAILSGNRITARETTAGDGINAWINSACTDNVVINFGTAYENCNASIDNVTLPAP